MHNLNTEPRTKSISIEERTNKNNNDHVDMPNQQLKLTTVK